MGTMIDVLNSSSGQSAATSDKFPNHVLTGRYAAGFANSLMSKDLRLYLSAADGQGSPSVLGQVTAEVWERFTASQPGVDFTRIYPFVEGS
jgi:3-hydroxyisobutyrate dehydrogenase-like beta-hydroxyacid dehydrogenase